MPGITAQNALASFIAHPRTFLKKYPVCVSEFVGRASGVLPGSWDTAGMHDGTRRPGRILGALRTHETQSMRIGPVATMAFSTHAFQVHFVQMYSRDVPIDWYATNGGPNIIVTPQLTGCSVAIRAIGGNEIEMTHIQPTGAEAGDALNTRLGGMGLDGVYGRNSYSQNCSVTIMGARVGGRWKVYAQKMDRRAQRIYSVSRIYP
jgi:hypothetical protein